MTIKLHVFDLPAATDKLGRNKTRSTAPFFELEHRIQPRTPNSETAEVLRRTECGEEIVWFTSLDDLIAECEAYAESPDD